MLSGTYDGLLPSGTIAGDVSIAPGTSATFINGANFSGANATFGTNATLNWNQIGSLTGKALSLGQNSSVVVGPADALTLGGTTTTTGDVNLNSSNLGASITNQGTVTHNSGTGYLFAPTFTNQGSITGGPGTYLYVGYYNGYTITNAAGGMITADGAGANIYLHEINNQGTLTAQNGGALYFQSSNTTASLGNVVLGAGGGHAYLNGTLDNSVGTLNAPTGGSFELYGGTINNGSIASGALSFTGSGGTLSNVSYTGDFNLPTSATVTFTNGSNFTGANASFGANSGFYWNQTAALTGKALTFGSGGYLSVNSANTLTLDSATTATGDVNLSSSATGASITNQGSITHTSGTGYVFAPTFTNQGSITAGPGSYLYVGYYNGYSINNASGGAITADGANATIYLQGINNQGTLTARNGGTLLFQSNNTTASLGNVVIGAGGSHAYLNGTLDNTAATLNAPTGGTFELYNGTINNGTIAAGALSFTSSGGTLSNVGYTGDLNLPASTYVTFTNGSGFTGANASIGAGSGFFWNQTAALTGKALTFGSGGYLSVNSANALTLDSATTATGDVNLSSSTTGASITNQGTINHTTGTGYVFAPTFTNQGSITAGPSSYLYVGYYNGYSINNASGGTITADGANASIYLQSINNQGTLTARNGGALYFQNTNTTASLGNVVIGAGGGHAYLNGTLDNSAGTLNAATGGPFELYGGTINNGTIAPGALSFTSSGGTLSNAAYTGDLNLPTGTYVTFTNGTTFTGANANLATSSGLYWNQTATLVGKSLTFANGSFVSVNSANALTLDSATTATGDVNLSSSATGASITNQGTITHTSGTGYVFAPTFTNRGSITAGPGTYLYVGYYSGYSTNNASGGTITANGANANLYLENINNQGTLTAQNGGTLLFQGTNTTASLGNVVIGSGGGHAYLNGTLDNTGATLNAPTGGSFEAYGATINNGTIAPGALSFTSSGGTLSNVSYSGDLTVQAGTYAVLTNGTAFSGANLNLSSSAGLFWSQNGTLAGKALSFGPSAYVFVGNGESLTLDSATTATGDVVIYSGNAGASITNQGTINHTTGTGYLYSPTFTNQGTINVGPSSYLYLGSSTAGYSFTNPAGGVINVTGGTANLQSDLTNAGLLNVQSGSFYASTGALTNGPTGTIMGSGTIYGNLTLAGGTLSPGNSIGTLTIASGSLIVTNPATLNLELGGTAADQILIQNPGGVVDIGTGLLTLNLSLLSVPTGSTYNLINITGGTGFTGYFAGLPLSGNTLTATYLGVPYTFSVQYLGTGASLNFTPVPEPGTLALLAAGLLVVAGTGWRRRRRTA